MEEAWSRKKEERDERNRKLDTESLKYSEWFRKFHAGEKEAEKKYEAEMKELEMKYEAEMEEQKKKREAEHLKRMDEI